MNDPAELAGRQRRQPIAAGEQPAARHQDATPAAFPPPCPEDVQELRREHGVAILLALALLDPQEHARRIDVTGPEVDDLRGAQAGAVGHRHRRLGLRPRSGFQEGLDLSRRQHRRQLLRLARHDQAPGKVGAVEGDAEEEAQRRDRAVEARRLHPLLALVQLPAAQVVRRRRVGRAAEEGGEHPHAAHVLVLRPRAEAAHGHVLDHPRTQRARGLRGRLGHRGAPRTEGEKPVDAHPSYDRRHAALGRASPSPMLSPGRQSRTPPATAG